MASRLPTDSPSELMEGRVNVSTIAPPVLVGDHTGLAQRFEEEVALEMEAARTSAQSPQTKPVS